MSTPEALLQKYQGQIVPRSFHGYLVAVSYLVSFLGAVSTLELINRRTSRNGFLNQVFLVSAAVTMGGISIWSMHFVGNRAIVLAQDEPELQIVYSSGYTAISFFLPIVVLLTAFIAAGTNDRVSFWRIGGGGTLAGGAICGMHYIGDASIVNYHCEYEIANVVGSVVIAVAASNVALSMFFLWRASWTNSWWKRLLCGVLLAGAVSGMHWSASTGTNYRLVRLYTDTQISRETIVIVVSFLSFGAALVVAGVVFYGSWVARSNTSKARHIVLAAAIFDRSGRILVSPDGMLPSEKVTDTYVERTPSDTFSIENPLFQWMFQASRSWNDINKMIASMRNHLAHLASNGRRGSVHLITENGQLVEQYDLIFRELFCLAAANLATRLRGQLVNVGVLWDDILPTGKARQHYPGEDVNDASERGESMSIGDSQGGWGSLMFLVRHLEHPADVEKLEAAGFRFADIRQVSGIIRSGMQIKSPDLSQTLINMATFAEKGTMLEPAVHLGFFGIRARVGGHGFDLLVEKGARGLLPASRLPFKHLEPWQTDLLQQHDGLKIPLLQEKLIDPSRKWLQRELEFITPLASAISALRTRIDDQIFDEATLSCRTVQVPCQPRVPSNAIEGCTMIVLHFVIPINYSLRGSGCEFIPLSFFRVHQMAYKDSPYQAFFAQGLHRELAPAIQGIPSSEKLNPQLSRRGWQRDWIPGVQRLTRGLHGRGRSISGSAETKSNTGLTKVRSKRYSSRSDSIRSSSTLELWSRNKSDATEIFDEGLPDLPTNTYQTKQPKGSSNLGGILVSQEIKVAVSRAEEVPGPSLHDGRSSQDQKVPDSQHLSAPSAKRGHHARTKTEAGRRFELTLLAKDKAKGEAGQALGLTVGAERGTPDEMVNFVDELFSMCIERR